MTRRRTVSLAATAVLCLFLVELIFQPSKGQSMGTSAARMKIATNKCWPKAGLGIIDPDLYIDLNSTKNELILAAGQRWAGAPVKMHQVVFVWHGKVLREPSSEHGFAIENSAVVSFEVEKVSFFDFASGIGGYYERK